jgi:hypothetical protein
VNVELDEICICCEESDPDELGGDFVCPQSKRPCGHHCNHVWSHEICCWCGKEWFEVEDSPEVEMGRKVDC